MWFVTLMVVLFVAGVWAAHVQAQSERKRRESSVHRGKHALPTGYMNPQVEVWRLAAETGETFNDIFLKRTAREDMLEERVRELEKENNRLRDELKLLEDSDL